MLSGDALAEIKFSGFPLNVGWGFPQALLVQLKSGYQLHDRRKVIPIPVDVLIPTLLWFIQTILRPIPWNWKITILAFSVRHIHLKNIKMRSINDPPIAGGAVRRIMNMTRNISNINIS